MSADQRKKRLSGANVFGYSSKEQSRAKKKHLSSSQFDLNWKLSSHTSLKWDDNEKRAVYKGEQIGLSKRDLRPFKAPVPHHENSLADVIDVPKDIFELDDLAHVLSYEVWQSILTEEEKNHLTQFLPRSVNPDQAVQGLLDGDNLHFGNPFLKWSSALYSGELHPEVAVHHDQTFRANKKAYYSEMQKYHDNMIRNLQKLKDRCANAKDPEVEIEQMMRRIRKQPGKELRYHNREQSVAADEKAFSSDTQSPLKTKGSDLFQSKETRKDKDGKQVGSPDVMKAASKPKKKETSQKTVVNYGDGSKYMSYVKISKSQHELVRSMKQSGNSIQSKALNGVFGNFNSFNVKPYVMFEEEEQKRIEEYWSSLATKDLPSAFSKWGKVQEERAEVMKLLCLEIEEKLKHLLEDEEMDHSDGTHYNEGGSVGSDDTDHNDGAQEDEAPESASDDGQDSDSSSAEEQTSLPIPSLDVNQFAEEHDPLQISSLDVNQKCISMDLNEEDNHISPKSNDACSIKSECHVTAKPSEESHSSLESPEKNRSVDVVVNEEVAHSSAPDVWPAITMVGSSFCPSGMDYASCSEMPLKHSAAIEDQTAQLMDLGSGIPVENPSKSLLPQQADQMPFFGTYQNDERHDLLHTIVKRDNYHEVPKKTTLGFHPTTSLLMEPSQFPVHSREQLHPSFPLEARHRASGEFYLPPNIQENLYPDNSRYSIPRPEQLTPISTREWSSVPRFSAPPMHAPLSSSMALMNPNWFPVENRVQGGWSGSEVFSNPTLGSASGGDQSLFSVLTQCNNLRPAVAPSFSTAAPAFSAMGPTDKFIPTVNFAENLGVGVLRSDPQLHPVAASPLDYLSGHEIAPSTLKTGDMGWMNNMSHQSSTLHDPTGKPFPKSWNQ